MTPLEKRKKKLASGIFSLFFTWLVAAISLNGILFLGLIISKKWLPFVVIGIMILIMMATKATRMGSTPLCYRIPAATVRILFISALAMFIINIVGVNWEPRWVKPQPFNAMIPYVCALVVYTVAAFVALWFLVIGRRMPVCVHCQIRNGSYTERGLIAKLFHQESAIQLKVLGIMSAIILVVDWGYYYLYYININYNTRDLFFFIGLPTLLTLLSVIYFFTRYNSMWRHYCHNPAMESIHGNSTALRFIVIVGDHMLLDLHNEAIVDTPMKCFLPFTTKVDINTAEQTFFNLTGVRAPRMQLAYESEETTTLANVFHYLCFFNSISELAGCKVPGQLYSYKRILKMVHEKLLAPELRSELERIYTVAMAWKTYKPDGRRIYPVKHYRPSFRIGDIKNYNVDYNDKRWLAVTANNEDRHFYRLRRIWNKHIHGV